MHVEGAVNLITKASTSLIAQRPTALRSLQKALIARLILSDTTRVRSETFHHAEAAWLLVKRVGRFDVLPIDKRSTGRFGPKDILGSLSSRSALSCEWQLVYCTLLRLLDGIGVWMGRFGRLAWLGHVDH